MLAKITAFFVGNWRILLAAIALMPLVFMLGQCKGEKIGRAQMTHAIDQANLAAAMQKARADENAARQRLTDTIAVNTQEREMIDAVRQGPDSAPDNASLRLGCDRLRRANGDRAPIAPACAGLGR